MGRVRAIHGSGVGRVATTLAVTVAVITTVTACGSSEPATATMASVETPAIVTDPDSKRPTCEGTKMIPLGPSQTSPPEAEAVTVWHMANMKVRINTDLHLVGALANQGTDENSLHGFKNVGSELQAGSLIEFTSTQFTVPQDIAATLTQIDGLTLCIVLPPQ